MSKTAAAGPACCIVLTTDQTYLFPTLISAMQARRQTSPEHGDVMICHFGIDARAEAVFAPICAAEGIGLLSVDPDVIERATPMMSRLFLDRFMPAHYRQFLYLDGDVHVARSLDPLVRIEVPAGRFLAANDPMTFLLGDRDAQSVDLARHLAAIGLCPKAAARYFNTGVLRIARDGWDAIGAEAWRMTIAGMPSRFPDQDPLNVVGAMRHDPLSLAWNFPIFMRNARVAAAIDPCITHFMSSPKPWHGAYRPWAPADCTPYTAAIARYPALAAYRQRLSPRRRLHYMVLQNVKRASESVTWGFSARRARILAYEATALLSGRR